MAIEPSVFPLVGNRPELSYCVTVAPAPISSSSCSTPPTTALVFNFPSEDASNLIVFVPLPILIDGKEIAPPAPADIVPESPRKIVEELKCNS